MGLSSSIYLTYQQHSYSVSDFIRVLLAAGWNYSWDGTISFLPLGDTDYEWTWSAADKWSTIFLVLNQKWINKEIVGIEMFWEDSGRSLTFLFNPIDNYLALSVERHRVCIEDGRLVSNNSYKFTDFSWYLERVLHPLLQLDDLIIISVECDDL